LPGCVTQFGQLARRKSTQGAVTYPLQGERHSVCTHG
jgi:hypothetical protein